MFSRIALSVVGAAGLLALVCACHPSGSPSAHGATKAAAAASAFATNPAIRNDEVRALRKLAGCTATATSGELVFTVTTTTQGQASAPGTATPAYPHVTVTHWSISLLHHLGDKIDAAINCAAPKGTAASAKSCVKHLNLPTSKASIQPWLIGVSNCMVGAPQ
jgi:hypothetical protein